MIARSVGGCLLLLALVLPSSGAAQVEAWRTQHDSELADPRSFFDFFGTIIFPNRPTALAADGTHWSTVSVYDGALRSLLVKHDAEGKQVWVRSEEGSTFGSPVAIDDLGNSYFGTLDSDSCSRLHKVDADGALVWTAALTDPPACEVSISFLEVADGAIYASGVFDDSEAVFVARFAGDGSVDWSYVRQGDPDTQPVMWDLAVDSAGSAVTAGTIWDPGTNYLVMKVDSSGQLVWERTYDNGSLDAATSLVIGPEDRVTVTGISSGEIGLDFHTIQYDAQGNELWSDRLERESFLGFFQWLPHPAIAGDSLGNIYLTGSVGAEAEPELLLQKYAPNGSSLFSVSLPPVSEGRRVVTVESDDRVYVSGFVQVGDVARATLHAFDLDGQLLWDEAGDWAPSITTVPAGLTAQEGRVVMTASASEPDPLIQDTFWLALDPGGTVLWQAGEPVRGLGDFYCAPSYDETGYLNRSGACLHVAVDGSTYLTGSDLPQGLTAGLGHRTVKLDAGGSLDWTRGFIESGEDAYRPGASASALGPSGSLHVAGSGWSTVTYDALGAEQWLASRDLVVEVRAVGTDSTGAVYVAGRDSIETAAPVSSEVSPMTTGSSFSVDWLLVKYTAGGGEAWTRTYAGPGGGDDQILAQLVTPDDRIVLVGQISADPGFHGLARAYDTEGEVLFSRDLAGSGGPAADARLGALAVSGDDIVAAGRSSNGSDLDALVVRLDVSGTVVWRRDLEGVGEGDDEATAVAVDPDGNAYVAGRTWNGDDFDVLVVKLDPSGNELWRRAIDLGHGDDEAWSAAFDGPGPGKTTGSLWIAGRSSNGSDTDALTLRLDAEGSELFRDLVAGSEQRDDEHYDLVIGPVPGHATVAGVSAEIDESYNFQAIRYVTTPLDVDYDGEAGALTDGMLIQRWLFGFRGSALETGTVDRALCVRCPAEQIDLHLSAIVKLLDVDGDGAAEPVTDGALLLRWLFGFRGDTLVTGVIDTEDCTRCEAAAIETYLVTLAD